jgi:hypothetical protein
MGIGKKRGTVDLNTISPRKGNLNISERRNRYQGAVSVQRNRAVSPSPGHGSGKGEGEGRLGVNLPARGGAGGKGRCFRTRHFGSGKWFRWRTSRLFFSRIGARTLDRTAGFAWGSADSNALLVRIPSRRAGLCFPFREAIFEDLPVLANNPGSRGVYIVELFAAHSHKRRQPLAQIRPTIIDLTPEICHGFRSEDRRWGFYLPCALLSWAAMGVVRNHHGLTAKGIKGKVNRSEANVSLGPVIINSGRRREQTKNSTKRVKLFLQLSPPSVGKRWETGDLDFTSRLFNLLPSFGDQ